MRIPLLTPFALHSSAHFLCNSCRNFFSLPTIFSKIATTFAAVPRAGSRVGFFRCPTGAVPSFLTFAVPRALSLAVPLFELFVIAFLFLLLSVPSLAVPFVKNCLAL